MSYIKVKEQVFIRNTSKGDFLLLGSAIFGVDKIAQAVLELCDGTRTFEDVVRILAERFSEPEKDVEEAVSSFVKILEGEGVLAFTENPSPIDPIYDYSRPSSINIEITYLCNEYCNFCASNAGVPQENELTLKEIDNLLDEVISSRINPVTITGGEPLLKKDLVLHMTEKVYNAGLEPNLLTNGILVDKSLARQLKEAGIQSVQVSLDGACPETHDVIRGRKGGFKKALKGIEALREASIEVSISSVLTRENFDEMKAIYNLGEALEVPVTSADVSPIGRGFDKALLLTPQQMCEHFCYTHETDEREVSMLAMPRERCSIGTSPVVTPVGDVYPCMLTKYEPLKLGNIRKSTLQEIWQNSDLLQELYTLNVHKIEPCKTCKNRFFCGGGCRGHAFAYHQTVYKNDPYRCPATTLIIKEILKRGDGETKREVLELIQ
ncbi:MAG: radical SAM protein [Theionarchaea archaeon]|nr:radical SAM protein [Theionarchaea archaeon]